MGDDDPLALFFVAERAYQSAAHDARMLEEARDEALLQASRRLNEAELARVTRLTRGVVRRILRHARARSASESVDGL
jgi:hypothetical protein